MAPVQCPCPVVRMFPRRKKDHIVSASHGFRRNERVPHFLDLSTISTYFSCVQQDAAAELGISVTSLKQACRKLGITRWPGPKRRAKFSFVNKNMLAQAHRKSASLESSLSEASTRCSPMNHELVMLPRIQILQEATSQAVQDEDYSTDDLNWLITAYQVSAMPKESSKTQNSIDCHCL